MIRRQISAETAQQRLESLCARAEHCRYELEEKLRKWGISMADAEKILDSMKRRRFFDDARFARAYARDKLIYSGWGRMKIMLGLRTKRIDSPIISEAIDSLDPDEYARVAADFLHSRARSIKEGNSYEGRTRLYRAGLQRGFESQLVSRIVKDPATWSDNTHSCD